MVQHSSMLIDAAERAGIAQWPVGHWNKPYNERKAAEQALADSILRRLRNNEFPQATDKFKHFLGNGYSSHSPLPAPASIPYAKIEVRNLIYHICPLKANDGWRHNLYQLSKRLELFNGKRVAAIAYGEGLHAPRIVKQYLRGCDFIELPNDTELREVATFLPLLLSVQNEPGATFYAHTKGNSTTGDQQAVMYWRNIMYARLLDYWDEVSAALTNHALVGTHKITWEHGRLPFPTKLEHGNWMFAGTFYWFRNDLVFNSNCNWRNIPVDRYGAEAWPGGLFDESAGKSLFQPGPADEQFAWGPYDLNIYDDVKIEDEANIPEPPDYDWSGMFPASPRKQMDIAPCTVIREAIAGPKTIVIVGAYRGGTSFLAEACKEIGIPMGENFGDVWPTTDYISYEDIEFSTALDEKKFDEVTRLARLRDAKYGLWGFKKPSSSFFMNELLTTLRNPHLLVILRDPLASAQSSDAHGGRVTFESARGHIAQILELLDKHRAPTLAISYERAKHSVSRMKEQIECFLNIGMNSQDT